MSSLENDRRRAQRWVRCYPDELSLVAQQACEQVVKTLMSGLALQIDLLVKWLGTESSLHAVSIRSSNAGNPKRGLQRLWERLDERYGSPVVKGG
jgi:hypothetical protein